MQALGWGFPAERSAWAAVELVGDGGQVGGVVAHVHLRPAGELCPRSVAHLLRAPLLVQHRLDGGPQLGVLADLPALGAGRRASARAWTA